MELHSLINMGYLLTGTPRQRTVYQLLTETKLFERISQYTPVLCGTIPIAVDLPESDLDIICEVHAFESFAQDVTELMTTLGVTEVQPRRKEIRGIPSIIISCTLDGVAMEFFGQPLRVTNQYAYRHMMIEHRILALGGSPIRDEVMRHRKNGIKTEPAFAHVLGLAGDPFEALLQLEGWSDEEIQDLLPKTKSATR